MPSRRKRFSASQSKDTSERLRTATVGTHMTRPTKHMNADSVGFSSARKQKRASRGFVDNVLATGETSSSSRRVQNRNYPQKVKRKVRLRSLLILLVCVAVVGGFGLFAASAAFFASLDAKLQLENSNASEALAPSRADEAVYCLVSADLSRGTMEVSESEGDTAPDNLANEQAFALVRLEKQSKRVSVLSIPANMNAPLSNGSYELLGNIARNSDDATLIKAVNSVTECTVNHLVKIDAAGVVQLVDDLGGLTLTVRQDVDDAKTESSSLTAGEQTLSGDEVLILLKAHEFKEEGDTQAQHQRDVLFEIAKRVMGSTSVDCLLTLDKVGGTFRTDVDAGGAKNLAADYRGFDVAAVEQASVPGYEREREGSMVFSTSGETWEAVKEAFLSGNAFPREEKVGTVAPSSFTLTVRNGSGITGAASHISEQLKQAGFSVTNDGNTDMQVYDETLVIYNEDSQQAAAQTVVESLGVGRTVQDSIHYQYSTDVLLVIGKDIRPSA